MTDYAALEVEQARAVLAHEGYTGPEVEAILAAIMGAGLTLPYPGDGAVVTHLCPHPHPFGRGHGAAYAVPHLQR